MRGFAFFAPTGGRLEGVQIRIYTCLAKLEAGWGQAGGRSEDSHLFVHEHHSLSVSSNVRTFPMSGRSQRNAGRAPCSCSRGSKVAGT